MPKTLSQAEKNAIREQRNQEKAFERDQAKQARDLTLRKRAEEEKEAEIPSLTKKALKKAKKAEEKFEKERLKIEKEKNIAADVLSFPAEAELPALPLIPPAPATSSPSSYAEIFSELMLSQPLAPPPSSIARERLEMARAIAAAEAAREVLELEEAPARLVENHSTYCEGLRPVLVRLQSALPSCTIIPGKISCGESRYETLELHFQRAADSNTYKFVARNGGTAQDVMISVSDADKFTEAVVCERVEKVLAHALNRRASIEATEVDLPLSAYNRSLAAERKNAWKPKHQKKHQEEMEKEKERKIEDKVRIFSRTLHTKGLPAGEVEACAARDVKIVSGESRGKHSMS